MAFDDKARKPYAYSLAQHAFMSAYFLLVYAFLWLLMYAVGFPVVIQIKAATFNVKRLTIIWNQMFACCVRRVSLCH